jgi:hypothetical protein
LPGALLNAASAGREGWAYVTLLCFFVMKDFFGAAEAKENVWVREIWDYVILIYIFLNVRIFF